MNEMNEMTKCEAVIFGHITVTVTLITFFPVDGRQGSMASTDAGTEEIVLDVMVASVKGYRNL